MRVALLLAALFIEEWFTFFFSTGDGTNYAERVIEKRNHHVDWDSATPFGLILIGGNTEAGIPRGNLVFRAALSVFVSFRGFWTYGAARTGEKISGPQNGTRQNLEKLDILRVSL